MNTHRIETIWLIFIALILATAAAIGCGSVTPIDRAAGGGDGGAVGGAGGVPGAAGAGQLEEAGAGGAGGAAGAHQIDASAPIDAGPHVGASTAPACLGSYAGSLTECPRIAKPAGGSIQCELGCSSIATENVTGCLFSRVTYCVASCAACVW